MCCACVITSGAKLSREHAFNMFSGNRSGSGFAYIEDNLIKIKKGYFDFNLLWEDFDKIQQNNDKTKLFHARIATCGSVCEANCHPWKLSNTAALVHNGMFNDFIKESHRISDTGLFVEQILAPVFEKYPNTLPNQGLSWLLRKNIGFYNKVAILNVNEVYPNGYWVIFNVDNWEKEDGLYFSNTSYKSYKYESRKEKNWKAWGKRNSQPKRKNPKYRIVGEELPLTPIQISKLTHTKKKKIKQLVYDGLVEPVWDDELDFTLSYDRRDPEYKKFWMNKPNEIFPRDKINMKHHLTLY
jgi:hypothetical protein